MYFCYKLRIGCYLIGAFLVMNFLALLLGLREGRRAALRRYRQFYHTFRFYLGDARLTRLVMHCKEAGVPRWLLHGNPESGYVIASQMVVNKQFQEALELTTQLIERWGTHTALAKCFGVRANARVWLGQYNEALADLAESKRRRAGVYIDFAFASTCSFIHSQRGDVKQVLHSLSDRYSLGTTHIQERLAELLAARCQSYIARYPSHQTLGILIGNYDAAVGHAILDPFHTYQLYKDRFDQLIIIHPPVRGYAQMPWLAVQILNQYMDQMETDDPVLLSMAWQFAGEIRFKNVTFLLHNYWSLNRAVVKARQAEGGELTRTYFSLPPRLIQRAKTLLPKELVLRRPLVVVHMREHGFHNLSAQSFRNVNPLSYVPALRWLLNEGYQVVRIGDNEMTPLSELVPGLCELPLLKQYTPALDLLLLQHCQFMISCQSGPCSFARAFGKPNLILNAVYHYTLLPEKMELFGFKQYVDKHTDQPLGVKEIFERGGHFFDRSTHFDDSGILLKDMEPQELLAAVQEMHAWMQDPDLPESPQQQQFRKLMQHFAENPPKNHPLWHPNADYIGYALPEGRILDSLCELRPGYLPTLETAQPRRQALAAA